MRRLSYRIYRFSSGLSHSARRRLTPGGWIAVVAMILTAGMATDVDQSIGYQAFAFLLCLSAAALVSSLFFRVPFAPVRTLPRFGTVGQPLQYGIAIQNLGRQSQAGLFVYDELADPRPSFDDFIRATQPTRRRRSFRVSDSVLPPNVAAAHPQSLPALLPGADATVEMRLVPQKRGILHFSDVSLARPDPFMLVRSFCSAPLPASVTILPRRYPLPNIPLPGASHYRQGGVSFASSIGQSEEFVALREYRYGDPLRRIHWRSWAKVGRPVVKEFQDEFFVRHALILDTFTDPDDREVFEEAVSVAASFACSIDTQESLLDLLFVGPEAYCFTVGRGLAHGDQMLEILASVQTCSDRPFDALQQIVIEHSAAVSGCICIFVAWDQRRQELVQRLEVLGVPLLVLVVREKGSPPLSSAIALETTVHEIIVGSVAETLATL